MNVYISNLELGNDFLHMTCKAQVTKENLDLFKVLKIVLQKKKLCLKEHYQKSENVNHPIKKIWKAMYLLLVSRTYSTSLVTQW